MKQTGVLNSIITLDDLSYTYFANSNQLWKVADAAPASNPFLGDFTDTSLSTNDYAYDVNGNLLRDNTSISTCRAEGMTLAITIWISQRR